MIMKNKANVAGSKQQKALNSLHISAGCSVPLVFAFDINSGAFHREGHIRIKCTRV